MSVLLKIRDFNLFCALFGHKNHKTPLFSLRIFKEDKMNVHVGDTLTCTRCGLVKRHFFSKKN